MDFTVEQNRIFRVDDQGKLLAEVLFPNSEEGLVTITRTFVDDSLRGQNVASKLMEALVPELQSQNKKAKAVCSYAKQWFAQHPEHNNLIQP